MAEMRTAVRAYHLGADRTVTGILLGHNIVFISRGVKAGPAGSRIKLSIGIEEGGPTAGAGIHPIFVAVMIFAGERRFGTFLAADTILLRCQLLLPVFVGLSHDSSLGTSSKKSS